MALRESGSSFPVFCDNARAPGRYRSLRVLLIVICIYTFMSKSNIPKGAFLFFMSQRIYLCPGGWKERTAAGGWLFRWYDLRFSKSKRRCLWDQLAELSTMLCPRCGYEWMPRVPAQRPKACPVCKVYFTRYMEPEPPGWERVHPAVWANLR